jgi:exosortase
LGLVVALALLAALAYRHLLFWDPSAPGLPDTEWFFFGMDDTAPRVVFAIAVFLLFRRRERLTQALGGKGSPLLAIPLLATGFAFFLWAHYVDAPDLLLVSLLPFCLGSAMLVGGAPFTREMAFPILFLAFALPFPGVLTNQIVFPLQLSNAGLIAQLLSIAGTPVVQVGDMLYLADRHFEIVETCSGLRAMVVLAMAAAGLVCYSPARGLHLLLLVASACVIAYCLNVARVLLVVVYPESEETVSHAIQGMVPFLFGGAAIIAVDAVLRRWLGGGEAPASPSDPAAAAEQTGTRFRVEHVMALAILLGLMVGASAWMPRWTPRESPNLASIHLPEEFGGWKAIEQLKPNRRYLGSVYFKRERYRRYRRGDETVSIFVGWEDRLDRSRSLLSPKNLFPGPGWEAEEQMLVELEPERLQGLGVVARSHASRILSYCWYQGVEGTGMEVLRAWLATDRSFLRRPWGALVIRLSTELSSAGDGRSRAEARLREVAELLPVGFSGFGDGTGNG